MNAPLTEQEVFLLARHLEGCKNTEIAQELGEDVRVTSLPLAGSDWQNKLPLAEIAPPERNYSDTVEPMAGFPGVAAKAWHDRSESCRVARRRP